VRLVTFHMVWLGITLNVTPVCHTLVGHKRRIVTSQSETSPSALPGTSRGRNGEQSATYRSEELLADRIVMSVKIRPSRLSHPHGHRAATDSPIPRTFGEIGESGRSELSERSSVPSGRSTGQHGTG
jgi:hypothetical protein